MASMKPLLLSTSGSHNLPLHLTPFVGRHKERAQLAGLLADPVRRLLTLVGPGGIGKTRLGLQIAADSLPLHPDGVWLVQLADLSDPVMVPQSVASELRVIEQPGRPLLETLSSRLQPMHLLLVLDNCEHLLNACAQLAHSLLSACPGLRILATSREPLHVPGEVRWPVPPLSLPDARNLPSIEDLVGYEAVRLFVDRAEAAVPSFTVTSQNAPAIAQICHRLDGLPLAIELAAARLQVLSVAQIAARLDDRFRLLVANGLTQHARQQTLQATLDWSHDLLAEQEQVLLRRLSVFAGDFGLEAVETVCSGGELDQVGILDLLAGLVDKSLVMVERKGGQARRYRLLETVRHYALGKLRASGEEAQLREAHLVWCLELAEQAEPYLWGAAEAVSLARLDLDGDNLRAALQWSLENGRIEENLRLATKLAWYWYVRAHLHEGRHWLEQALAASGALSASFRASALSFAGALAVQQGDQAGATALLKQAIALYSEPGCIIPAGWSMVNLGLLALYANDYSRAEKLLDQSMALFTELGDQAGIATVLLYQGIAAYYQDDHPAAELLLQQSLPSLRELGDTVGVARAIHGLGVSARHEGNLPGANALFREALQVAREKGARLEISDCLEGLAGVACARGRPDRAAYLFGSAEALREAIGAERTSWIRPDYVQDVAASRVQLEDKAFKSAWAAGRSAPLAEVIALALAEANGVEPGANDEDAPESRPLTPLQAAKRRHGGLTARERQVAVLIAQGKTNSAIASELVVTVRTVEAHITHILRKLGFSSRAQVAAWAVSTGLAPPPKTLEEEGIEPGVSPGWQKDQGDRAKGP
jgi:predicted ATPase/DNA-binding CsgD family transcriptional regulator